MSDLKGQTVVPVNNINPKASKERKEVLAMQRKKNKALEELKAMNNIVSPVTKKVDVKTKRKQVVGKRSTEQILKDRNRDEKRYKSRSKSIRRIQDGSNKRWIGWRGSSEEVAPITTYSLYSDEKEN